MAAGTPETTQALGPFTAASHSCSLSNSLSTSGAGKATARLVREPSAVVTETVYEINNSPITIRETLSLNPEGSELTVNTTVRVEHGYQGPLPAGASKSPNVSTAVVVFVRRQ